MGKRMFNGMLLLAIWLGVAQTVAASGMQRYAVPSGAHPHDVAPAADGGVWYTAQHQGALGYLDSKTGKTRQISLGAGSAPHGVIVGPDGAAWVTDSGLNANVRVDPRTDAVTVYPLPAGTPYVNMNTATFDQNGVLWFTGQAGYYGRLDPRANNGRGKTEVFIAPHGRGPYGICTAPDGSVYYASLAGSHIARIDVKTGQATVIEPPTPKQGARRVWADSQSRIWVSEWHSGQVSMFDPKTGHWRAWKAPGDRPQIYAVFVDDKDIVWLSDWGANAMLRFDPKTERFTTYPHPASGARVRQILGRPGEVWLPESGTDTLSVIRE